MSARRVTLAGWVALVLGILFVLLQSYGWWDEVQARGDQGDWLEQWAITTHVLPTLLLVASVALGWRWPLAAGRRHRVPRLFSRDGLQLLPRMGIRPVGHRTPGRHRPAVPDRLVAAAT